MNEMIKLLEHVTDINKLQKRNLVKILQSNLQSFTDMVITVANEHQLSSSQKRVFTFITLDLLEMNPNPLHSGNDKKLYAQVEGLLLCLERIPNTKSKKLLSVLNFIKAN